MDPSAVAIGSGLWASAECRRLLLGSTKVVERRPDVIDCPVETTVFGRHHVDEREGTGTQGEHDQKGSHLLEPVAPSPPGMILASHECGAKKRPKFLPAVHERSLLRVVGELKQARRHCSIYYTS